MAHAWRGCKSIPKPTSLVDEKYVFVSARIVAQNAVHKFLLPTLRIVIIIVDEPKINEDKNNREANNNMKLCDSAANHRLAHERKTNK